MVFTIRVREALPVETEAVTPVGAVVVVVPVEEVYHVTVPASVLVMLVVVMLYVAEPVMPCVSVPD